MKETKTILNDASRRASVLLVASCLFLAARLVQASEESQTLETPLGPVKILLTISPESPSQQSPSTLQATVEKPRALRLDDDDLEGDYGDFDVESTADQSRELDDKRDLAIRSWKLYPKRNGENKLPPIPLRLVPTQDGAEDEPIVAILPARTLRAKDGNATTKSIDEIAPNLEPLRAFPFRWVLFAVAILALGAVLFFALRKRAVKKSETQESATPETPLEKALRELDALKESRAYLENRPEFYPQVVDVLRVYLRDEFKINAEEKTTQEILATIDATRALEGVLNVARELDDALREAIGAATLKTPEIKRELEDALNSVDLVKFAKRATTFNDASAVYNSVRKVVENAASEFTAKLKEVEEQIARQNAALEAAKETTDARPEASGSSQNSQVDVEKAN